MNKYPTIGSLVRVKETHELRVVKGHHKPLRVVLDGDGLTLRLGQIEDPTPPENALRWLRINAKYLYHLADLGGIAGALGLAEIKTDYRKGYHRDLIEDWAYFVRTPPQ